MRVQEILESQSGDSNPPPAKPLRWNRFWYNAKTFEIIPVMSSETDHFKVYLANPQRFGLSRGDHSDRMKATNSQWQPLFDLDWVRVSSLSKGHWAVSGSTRRNVQRAVVEIQKHKMVKTLDIETPTDGFFEIRDADDIEKFTRRAILPRV